MPDFAPGVFHGEKRFAKMAQRFEMAQQKGVQRFADFDRSAVGPLRSPSPLGLTRWSMLTCSCRDPSKKQT
jgi:hypothetical protein